MEHVSLNTWIQYYSDSIGVRETAVMYAHICSCPTCRAIFDRGARVRRALAAVRQAGQSGSTGAYRAVAGPGGGSAPEKAAGFLRIRLEDGENGGAFLIDTLETRGSGNKFALNPEADDKILRDDCDLLVLELSSGGLQVRLEETPTAFARIRSEAAEGNWTCIEGAALLPLPAGRGRVLEIFFIE